MNKQKFIQYLEKHGYQSSRDSFTVEFERLLDALTLQDPIDRAIEILKCHCHTSSKRDELIEILNGIKGGNE